MAKMHAPSTKGSSARRDSPYWASGSTLLPPNPQAEKAKKEEERRRRDGRTGAAPEPGPPATPVPANHKPGNKPSITAMEWNSNFDKKRPATIDNSANEVMAKKVLSVKVLSVKTQDSVGEGDADAGDERSLGAASVELLAPAAMSDTEEDPSQNASLKVLRSLFGCCFGTSLGDDSDASDAGVPVDRSVSDAGQLHPPLSQTVTLTVTDVYGGPVRPSIDGEESSYRSNDSTRSSGSLNSSLVTTAAHTRYGTMDPVVTVSKDYQHECMR